MNERLDVKEFLTGYLAEAEEHLSAANANLLALDDSLRKKETNPRVVRELFRSLHTLKGLSAMVGAEPIVDLTHEMETLLRTADRAGGQIPDAAVDLLLRGVRAIEERVASLGKGQAVHPAPKALLESLSSLRIEGNDPSSIGSLQLEPELLSKVSASEQQQLLIGIAKGRRAVRVDFCPSPEHAARGLNITVVRQRMAQLGELVKVMPRSVPSQEGGPAGVAFVLLVLTDAANEAIAEAVAASPADVKILGSHPTSVQIADVHAEDDLLDPPDSHRRNVVRVDVDRLDDALERLSVLVVTRSRLQRALADLAQGPGDLRTVTVIANESGRQLRDLRSAIMRARMVRVSDLLDRAPLIVRGLSKTSKKVVRLTVDSGKAELDKSVADRLFPAIVHLLRNAVDHGIELPAERISKGKAEEGHISVSCVERAGNRLELIISDDGRGIDRANVAERAGEPVPQTDAQLLDLITRPGLSTLETATQTSGRGVGMDIVKRIAVDELGGDLQLSTIPGSATTFTLRVPLSVTILDAFSFVCGDETFVIPVSSVQDLTEINPEYVVGPPDTQQSGASAQLLNYRGSALPLFQLSSLLGLEATGAERPKAIIVRHNAETYAFQVDRMVGQQEIVVRPVKDPLVDVEGIAGSTDLGDGRPTLVLDLPGIVRRKLNSKAVA